MPEEAPEQPEIALYLHIQAREGDAAHGTDTALVRRLESFERALEREITSAKRASELE